MGQSYRERITTAIEAKGGTISSIEYFNESDGGWHVFGEDEKTGEPFGLMAKNGAEALQRIAGVESITELNHQ